MPGFHESLWSMSKQAVIQTNFWLGVTFCWVLLLLLLLLLILFDTLIGFCFCKPRVLGAREAGLEWGIPFLFSLREEVGKKALGVCRQSRMSVLIYSGTAGPAYVTFSFVLSFVIVALRSVTKEKPRGSA